MCSPQSPPRRSKGRSPRTAAGSLRPSQAQPFAHSASHPRRHPAASPQQPRDRPSGTYPAGQPRTAAAVRTPGARPSPPIPARSKDARAGPSADNQLDQTQSTSRRTQPVPAIEGGKKNSSWRQTLVLFRGSKGKWAGGDLSDNGAGFLRGKDVTKAEVGRFWETPMKGKVRSEGLSCFGLEQGGSLIFFVL